MQKIQKHIALDFQKRNNVRVVYATQCDMNWRQLVISLFNDGDPYLVHANSGALAAINVLRPDGKSSSFPATITGVGEVTYDLTAWPVGVAGEVKMSLSLYTSSGERLGTDPFILYVAEGLYLGSQVEEDTENQTAFHNMMEKLAELNLKDEIRESKEAVREENELERKRKENDRINTEKLRVSAELTRDNSEAGRNNNELARQESEAERQEAEAQRQKNESSRVLNEASRCQVIDAILEGLDNLLELQRAYISSVGGA